MVRTRLKNFNSRCLTHALTGSLSLALLLMMPPVLASSIIYCCEDDRGRGICGDVLPAACYDRAYREMTPQGSVRRYVPAPLSADEIARRDAEQRRQREDAAKLLVQRRLDQALLETYPSLADIDIREARALGDIERDLTLITKREQELLTQRRQVLHDAGFHEGQSLGRDIENRIRIIDTELNAYQNVRHSKEQERQVVRERFAVDRARYLELIAGGDAPR